MYFNPPLPGTPSTLSQVIQAPSPKYTNSLYLVLQVTSARYSKAPLPGTPTPLCQALQPLLQGTLTPLSGTPPLCYVLQPPSPRYSNPPLPVTLTPLPGTLNPLSQGAADVLGSDHLLLLKIVKRYHCTSCTPPHPPAGLNCKILPLPPPYPSIVSNPTTHPSSNLNPLPYP